MSSRNSLNLSSENIKRSVHCALLYYLLFKAPPSCLFLLSNKKYLLFLVPLTLFEDVRYFKNAAEKVVVTEDILTPIR